jgi:hypothetical protein
MERSTGAVIGFPKFTAEYPQKRVNGCRSPRSFHTCSSSSAADRSRPSYRRALVAVCLSARSASWSPRRRGRRADLSTPRPRHSRRGRRASPSSPANGRTSLPGALDRRRSIPLRRSRQRRRSTTRIRQRVEQNAGTALGFTRVSFARRACIDVIRTWRALHRSTPETCYYSTLHAVASCLHSRDVDYPLKSLGTPICATATRR